MLTLAPRLRDGCLRILCLGAHSDDIEIGCAGTLLRWAEEYPRVEVSWVVLSGDAKRCDEARSSASELLGKDARLELAFGEFRDAHFPADYERIKGFVSGLREGCLPDIVLTHSLDDRHQDHRLVAELTWQTWRDQLILEYEIPKYEGDLPRPNLYVPLTEAQRERKTGHLLEHFGSQRSKDWFSRETFDGLMRIRGIECRAPSGFAEAFVARKIVF